MDLVQKELPRREYQSRRFGGRPNLEVERNRWNGVPSKSKYVRCEVKLDDSNNYTLVE